MKTEAICEFATSEEAFAVAKRMARFGRKKWIVWGVASGAWKTARIGKEVFRLAMTEAVGSEVRPGKFYCIHASTTHGETLGPNVARVWWNNMEAGHFDY